MQRQGEKPPKSENQICTVKETAEILGLSESFVRRHAKELGGTRLGGAGRWRFIPAEVKRKMFEAGEAETDIDRRVKDFFKGCQLPSAKSRGGKE